jgi:hypothetical protein
MRKKQNHQQKGIRKSVTGLILGLIIGVPVVVALMIISFFQQNRGSKLVVAERETVMIEGMKIVANTPAGSITIKAGKGFERTYTWNGCTRSLTMLPREKRWYGNYGIYYPGVGNHWEDCNGVTRAVVQEGQQHFDNLEQAIDHINTKKKTVSFFRDGKEGSVYTNDGLVVLWGIEHNVFTADVLQILINGNKPVQLPGAQDDLITVSFLDSTKKIQDEVGDLHIVESRWTGWSEKQPEDKITSIEPKKGEKVILNDVVGKYDMTILDLSSQSIRLTVDGLYLSKPGGGINLTGCDYQDFIINRGETVELNTCSMDEGVKWVISYLK